jgi:FemAB family protein
MSDKGMRRDASSLRLWLETEIQARNLVVTFRDKDRQSYTSAFEGAEYPGVDYDPLMLDYQIAYMRGVGWQTQDCSVTMFHDGRAVGICPAIVLSKDGQLMLSSATTDLFPPLYVSGLSGNLQRRLTKEWHAVVCAVAKKIGVTEWQGQESFSGRIGMSDWHDLLMASGAKVSVLHDLYVDLSLDLAEIRAGFRSSYKSLINKAERLWRMQIVDSEKGQDEWRRFHRLHAEAAGRETRPQATWDLQWAAIIQGRGFLVCLFDDRDDMVGGGYFHVTSTEGIYAVGAYNRTLFDRPLGHVVQYSAIKELKSRGIRWYRIGRRCYEADVPPPSEKELSISKFKSGFSTHLFPVYRTLNHA